MIEPSFLSALFGGILTFFAPCTFPMVPAFLGSLSVSGSAGSPSRGKVVLHAVAFVLGFAAIFALLGAASGTLGSFLVVYRVPLMRVAGALITLMGVGFLLGWRFPDLSITRIVRIPLLHPGTLRGAFLLGLLFGLGWGTCLGPLLGSILLVATTEGEVFRGALLLFVFALGIGIPFIFVSALIAASPARLRLLTRGGAIMPIIGGVFLVALGILLMTGEFASFTAAFLPS